jgi:hypothetical protein
MSGDNAAVSIYVMLMVMIVTTLRVAVGYLVYANTCFLCEINLISHLQWNSHLVLLSLLVSLI